jgi:hypothetical protein
METRGRTFRDTGSRSIVENEMLDYELIHLDGTILTVYRRNTGSHMRFESFHSGLH